MKSFETCFACNSPSVLYDSVLCLSYEAYIELKKKTRKKNHTNSKKKKKQNKHKNWDSGHGNLRLHQRLDAKKHLPKSRYTRACDFPHVHVMALSKKLFSRIFVQTERERMTKGRVVCPVDRTRDRVLAPEHTSSNRVGFSGFFGRGNLRSAGALFGVHGDAVGQQLLGLTAIATLAFLVRLVSHPKHNESDDNKKEKPQRIQNFESIQRKFTHVRRLSVMGVVHQSTSNEKSNDGEQVVVDGFSGFATENRNEVQRDNTCCN